MAAGHEILGRILRDRQERIPQIVDIALQQTATGSRSHSHLCALQQRVKTDRSADLEIFVIS
jgi:hypothetical protein